MNDKTYLNLSKKFLAAAAAAAIWSFALVYSQNNLFHHSSWDSSYARSGGIRSTGLDSLLSRQTLARNRLNPGNHGLRQKVISRNDFDWKKISFSAEMRPFSYLDLTIHSPEKTEGIRFSQHEFFPSMVFQEDSPDSFASTEEFPLTDPGKKPEIEIDRSGSITVNGKEVHTKSTPFSTGKIELTVSKSFVSNVIVSHAQDEKLSFLELNSFWKYFAIHLLLLSVLCLFLPFQFPLFIFLLGIIWTGFDYSWYSQEHFSLNQTSLEYKSTLPARIFNKWSEILGGESPTREKLETRYGKRTPVGTPLLCEDAGCAYLSSGELKEINKNEFRIFILGGSLTDGWGVSHPEKSSYPAALREKLSGKRPVSVLTSISPFISFYRHLDPKSSETLLKAFNPDLILLDVSPRFTEAKEFSEYLKKLKATGIPLLAFLAPMDVLAAAPEFVRKAQAGAPLTFPEDATTLLLKEAGVTLINPQVQFYLSKSYLKSNLFVDHSHLTDKGHRELGEVLAGEIAKFTSGFSPKQSYHR